MRFLYEPYIFRRVAKGRIFVTNSTMPFEFFLDCFQFEQPFFLVSNLDDGRIAIVPNAMCIPLNLIQEGFWPHDLLPSGYEYVTAKDATYPMIITAHPVNRFEEWLTKFEKCVFAFASQTITQFVSSSFEFKPLKEQTFKQFTREPVTA